MKMIKRVLAVVLTLAIAVIGTACIVQRPEKAASTPSEVVIEKAKVTVNCLKALPVLVWLNLWQTTIKAMH